MKDLYSRLGIDRGASAGEVRAALEIKPELGDCATILLHSEKRAVYDSAHTTLKMIGALRLRLGLDSGPSWFLKNYLDFVPTQKLARSSQTAGTRTQTAASPAALPATHPAPQPPNSGAPSPPAQSKQWAKQRANRRAKWLIPAAAVVIIGVILIAVLLW